MPWGTLIILLLFGVAIYTVIPDFFLHRLGLGSHKRQYGPGVVLTFDDGPDPEYTPRVLDVLRNYQVSAVFFLVGEKARKHPELVQKILAEGHQIGAHSQSHRYAWFMTPRQTWQEWKRSLVCLEEIAGEPITWVRPPWGTFNLATWLWMKKHHKKVILWNAEGHDWQNRHSSEEIAERILQRVNEGSIIVMHDSGGESGAPGRSLLALEIVCQRVRLEKKLPFIVLELPNWAWGRKISYLLWEKWEHLFARLYHVERISSQNILRLSKTKYQGPNLYQEDGRLLAKSGDTVGEIHIDSIRLQEHSTEMTRIAVKAMRKARESLPELCRFIAQNPEYQNLEVFLGFTLINRGVKGFGFHVQEVAPTWSGRAIALLQKGIMRVYHPAGKARSAERLGETPKLVWISREELLQRWLE